MQLMKPDMATGRFGVMSSVATPAPDGLGFPCARLLAAWSRAFLRGCRPGWIGRVAAEPALVLARGASSTCLELPTVDTALLRMYREHHNRMTEI